MISPVDYLERRIDTLKAERPLTDAGRIGRDAAIHELQNIVMAFKFQALVTLDQLTQASGARR